MVTFSHKFDARVEAELGILSGQEGDLLAEEQEMQCTSPDTVAEFVARIRVDLLAVVIGTAHGMYSKAPRLNFRRLEEIREQVCIPLVLHGVCGLFPLDIQNNVRKTIIIYIENDRKGKCYANF